MGEMKPSWKTSLCGGVVAAGAGLVATHDPVLVKYGAALSAIATALGFFFAADHGNAPGPTAGPPTAGPTPEIKLPTPPGQLPPVTGIPIGGTMEA